MKNSNHRHAVQWQAIEEVWINGEGRATVWSSDGTHLRQQEFQLSEPRLPNVLGDRRVAYRNLADPVVPLSIADAFQLADTVLSDWQRHTEEWVMGDRWEPRQVSGTSDTIDAEIISTEPHHWQRSVANGRETIRRWWHSIAHRGHHLARRVNAAARAAWRELTR